MLHDEYKVREYQRFRVRPKIEGRACNMRIARSQSSGLNCILHA